MICKYRGSGRLWGYPQTQIHPSHGKGDSRAKGIIAVFKDEAVTLESQGLTLIAGDVCPGCLEPRCATSAGGSASLRKALFWEEGENFAHHFWVSFICLPEEAAPYPGDPVPHAHLC